MYAPFGGSFFRSLIHLFTQMIDSLPELMEYLDNRGSKYGISAGELYEAIPDNVRNPSDAHEYMQMKDISHKTPLSHGGKAAGDNWILEDSSVNRSRGAEQMTESERKAAQVDAQHDANSILDGRQLAKTAGIGAALTVGGVAAEGALVAAETIAILPTLLTIAAISGGCFLAYKGIKKVMST